MGNALLMQPVGQSQQIAREAGEDPNLFTLLTVRLTDLHAGAHCLLAYIPSSKTCTDYLRGSTSWTASGGGLLS